METREIKTTLSNAIMLHDELLGTQNAQGFIAMKKDTKKKYLFNKIANQCKSEVTDFNTIRDAYILEHGDADTKAIKQFTTSKDGLQVQTKEFISFMEEMNKILTTEITLNIPSEITLEDTFDVEMVGSISVLQDILEVN